MPDTVLHHSSIPSYHKQPRYRLCDKGGSGGALVAPGGGEDTDGLVVAGQTVDTGLDQNEAELGVLVLAVALEVLADSDGLGRINISQPNQGCDINQFQIKSHSKKEFSDIPS